MSAFITTPTIAKAGTIYKLTGLQLNQLREHVRKINATTDETLFNFHQHGYNKYRAIELDKWLYHEKTRPERSELHQPLPYALRGDIQLFIRWNNTTKAVTLDFFGALRAHPLIMERAMLYWRIVIDAILVGQEPTPQYINARLPIRSVAHDWKKMQVIDLIMMERSGVLGWKERLYLLTAVISHPHTIEQRRYNGMTERQAVAQYSRDEIARLEAGRKFYTDEYTGPVKRLQDLYVEIDLMRHKESVDATMVRWEEQRIEAPDDLKEFLPLNCAWPD